jgi:hypothetical protein
MSKNTSANTQFTYPNLKPLSLQLRLQDSLTLNKSETRSDYIQREIEPQIHQFLTDQEILVLRGPRQAGKTTLLKKIGQKLTKQYSPEQVCLFTFEDQIVKELFVKDPQQFIQHYLIDDKPIFFLLDEVQYIKEAGKILKLIYDVFPQVKLIVTGSSSLDLNQLGRYLVGRAIYFEIYPFSFAEYLKVSDQKLLKEYRQHQFSWRNPKPVKSLFIKHLNQHLRQYLTYGGYPRVVLEPSLDKKQILLRNIYSTYVEKDVASLFGPKYKNKLSEVLQYLGASLGQMVQYQSICQAVGIRHDQLKQTLDILEQTYLIKQLKPFYKNQVTELRKNPKFYFIDPGMRNVLLHKFEFDQIEHGHLLENYVMQRLIADEIKYWRTTAKAEVDFVLAQKQIPIEVKTNTKITKSMRSFIETYQPEIAVVTDMQQSGLTTVDKTQVYTVPVALI